MRMAIFLSVFLTLYGSLHLYVYWKAKRAFGFHKHVGFLLGLFMGFMTVCPILVRVVERQGLESLAGVLAYTGYIWMGFLFLFVAVRIDLDIYGAVVYLFSRVTGGSGGKWRLSPRIAFFIALGVCLVGGVYALVEATAIQTEHIVIKTPKIPKVLGRIRIVQISDVHLGLIMGKRQLSRILDVVRAAKPDILVSTGDLLDGQIDSIGDLAKQFREIKPSYGKFAVNGNHEYYVGIERARKFCRKAGFTLLSHETFDIPGILLVAGVDDMMSNRYGLVGRPNEKQLLSEVPTDRFVLVLKHRPLLDETSMGLFDLQLSGHTHRGQIFPFTLLIKMLYPIDAGLLKLATGGFLYVNPGSGTWGPPMRFLAPPEVTVIDLVHGERKNS